MFFVSACVAFWKLREDFWSRLGLFDHSWALAGHPWVSLDGSRYLLEASLGDVFGKFAVHFRI